MRIIPAIDFLFFSLSRSSSFTRGSSDIPGAFLADGEEKYRGRSVPALNARSKKLTISILRWSLSLSAPPPLPSPSAFSLLPRSVISPVFLRREAARSRARRRRKLFAMQREHRRLPSLSQQWRASFVARHFGEFPTFSISAEMLVNIGGGGRSREEADADPAGRGLPKCEIIHKAGMNNNSAVIHCGRDASPRRLPQNAVRFSV